MSHKFKVGDLIFHARLGTGRLTELERLPNGVARFRANVWNPALKSWTGSMGGIDDSIRLLQEEDMDGVSTMFEKINVFSDSCDTFKEVISSVRYEIDNGDLVAANNILSYVEQYMKGTTAAMNDLQYGMKLWDRQPQK
jgi:hypothetical protein